MIKRTRNNKTFTRKNKRKKTLWELLMPIAKTLPFFAVLIFVVVAVLRSNPTEFLDVDISWNIDENSILTQEKLLKKIQPLIKDKYQLDLHEIKQTLEQEPWVAQANIKRLFWNSIRITIEEQQITMRWKNKKDCKPKKTNNLPCFGYVSNNGELFTPKKPVKSNAVWMISGREKETITQLYQDYKHYQTLIEPMKIKSISRTNIDQLIIEPNIKVILGYQMQNERLINFKKSYMMHRKKTSRVERATFDMRYPKGFTLSY